MRWIVLAAVALGVAGVAWSVLRTPPDPWPAAHGVDHADVSLDEAVSALRGEVTDVQLDAEQGRVSILVPAEARPAAVAAEADGPIVLDARFPVPYADEMVATLLAADIPFEVVDGTQPTATSEYVRSALPYAVLVAVLIAALIVARRHQRAASFEQSVGGRHQAVLDVPTTRFTDVLGADEAVEDLSEVVAFLTDPERFAAVGATAPKGVLLSGPPGCGKTLLARAVAGEAGAAFFAVSGSEFVEMYVGVGAKRVRNLFDRARASGRAIVFIDEIDAVGRARSSGGGAPSHEERENTLNQLLVELDGFTGSNVIVIAATNRSDLLDEALKRSGRFDREVAVARPDRAGRAALLRAYLRNRRVDPTLDIDAVADALAPRTAGLVGADMAVLANEAAINAARAGRTSISQDDLDAAVERAQIGKARTSAIVSERMRRIVAWHEAGHTVCALRTPGAPRPTRVSIVPRGGAGGVTWLDPGDDALRTRSEWVAQLVVSFGGRAGESLILGDDVTHGASGDIIAATDLATKMVCEWGMSGLGQTFIRADVVHGPTGEVVRTAVAELCQQASTQAEACLSANRELVDAVVAELLERETIDATVIERLDAAFPTRSALALAAG